MCDQVSSAEFSEQFELDWGDTEVPPKQISWLSPLANLILESQSIECRVLREWVEKVLPNIQAHLSMRHAKGMNPQELKRNDFLQPDQSPQQREKAIKTLSEMPVQSLAVHIVNGALSAWTVVQLAKLDDAGKRLFLAGFTMHDINKLLDEPAKDFRLGGPNSERYRQEFLEWGNKLGLWDFIPKEHWQDVAFLAANAEEVSGENRTLANYQELMTQPDTLEDLTDFVRLADLIVSAAFHPDDLIHMTSRKSGKRLANKVPEILGRVLSNKYSLRYHRTTENRGLLTQVIHNAVREGAESCGWKPFLFFPDGITYLVPKGASEPDLSGMPRSVRQKLVDAVKSKLGGLVSRDSKGIKFTPEYVELLDAQAAGELLIQRSMDILHDNKPVVTEERKSKTALKPNASLTINDLDLNYPASLTADRLAEAMFGLCKLLEDYHGGKRETYSEALIRELGLAEHLQAFNSIDYSGGVGYPWYYLGGHFAKQNPGLSAIELQQRITAVYKTVLATLGTPRQNIHFGFLEEYVPQVLSIGGQVSQRNFLGELARYEGAKGRGGKQVCAICNAPYAIRKVYSSYSNKKVVGPKIPSERGLCEVCQAEELLRRFALGQSLRDPGASKFLHIYPAYFFTPITAQAMRHAYNNFKNIVFSDVAKEWKQADFKVSQLIISDLFKLSTPPDDKRRLDKVAYGENEMHAYYLLGVPYLGRKPSETQAWVMPALLSLIMPLVFGVKVVASNSALPIYPTGAEFPEPTDMVVLDGVHAFWQHGIKRSSFGLTELQPAINAACAFYHLVSDAYRDGSGFPIWNQMGAVGRELDSDPLAVFGYADRIHSQATKGKALVTGTNGMSPYMADDLLRIYRFITDYYREIVGEGGERINMIEELVDRYATFYRARGHAAYARLRPLTLAAEVTLDSPPELSVSDLRLQIEGRLNAMLDGVRDHVTEGWIPKGAYSDAERQSLVEEFARYFLEAVFGNYCQGDRSILRKRLNLLKNGAEAVYVKKYGLKQSANGQSTAQQEDTNDVQ